MANEPARPAARGARRRPDAVFASETYGARLASELGARFRPVDPARQVVPVSASAIRADPLSHFAFLPAPVRAHFVRRVSVFGPESTGKSTLAARLARHFGTIFVPEYARTYIESCGGDIDPTDLPAIAAGQIATEEVLARRANRVLICDTDPLATPIWSEALFGVPMPELAAQAEGRPYHLTLLCDADVPWVPDAARYLPSEGEAFLARCRAALERARRRTVVVSGSWEQREATAVASVEALLRESTALPPWPPR